MKITTKDILEYLPYYPDIEEEDFSYQISQLQEMDELKLKSKEDIPNYKGQPLFSQELQKRFFSKHTRNQSMLVVHKPGTGKSCVADFIIENLKTPDRKPALVLVSNKDLVMAFKNEIVNRCTSGVYDVELTKEEKEGKTEEEIKKIKKKKMKQQLNETYNIGTRSSILKGIEKKSPEDIKKMYSHREIIVDEVHHFSPDGKGSEETKQYEKLHKLLHSVEDCRILLLSGTPIWDKGNEIAPIMNLILPINEELPVGTAFNNAFIKNNKLINEKKLLEVFKGRVTFLRAMTDNKREEIGITKPWMTHMKIFPVVMGDFQQEVYDKLCEKEEKERLKEGENYESWSINEINDFMDKINKGKIKKIVEGGIEFEVYTGKKKIKALSKKPTQKGIKEQEKAKEDAIKFIRRMTAPSGLRRNLLDASCFAFPMFKDGEIVPEGSYGTKGYEANIEKDTKKKFTTTTYKYKYPEVLYAITDNLPDYSSKLSFIADYIRNNPKEVIFVYDEYVTGGGGLINYGLVLEALKDENGRKEFRWAKNASQIQNSPKDMITFVTISSEDGMIREPKEIAKTLEIISSKENIYGDKCRVIFGSSKIAEGLTLKNVRVFISNIPHWNRSETDQANARIDRVGSLSNFENEEDRYIKTFLLASVRKYTEQDNKEPFTSTISFPEGEEMSQKETVDIDVFKIAEAKDIINSQLYRLMKRGAWDCALTYERNVLTSDIPGSRECDYGECNYVCDGYPEKLIDKNTNVWKYKIEKLQTQNYKKYYLKNNIDVMTDVVVNIMRKNPNILLSNLLDEIECKNYDNMNTVQAKTKCWIGEIVYEVIKLFKIHFTLRFDDIVKLIPSVETHQNTLLVILGRLIETHTPISNRYGFWSYLDEENNIFFLKESPLDETLMTAFYAQYPVISSITNLEDLNEISQLQDDTRLIQKECSRFENVSELINKLSYRSKITLFEDTYIKDPKLANKLFPGVEKIVNGLVFHELYDIEPKGLEYGVTSRSINPSGLRRVFEDEEWRYVKPGPEEEKIIEFLKTEKVEKVSLKDIDEKRAKELGYSGIEKPTGFFIKKGETGYTGKNITSWKSEELYDLLWHIKFYPEEKSTIESILKSKPTKKELINTITAQSYKELYGNDVNNLKEMDVNTLVKIIGVGKLSMTSLRNAIKKWFYKNNIVSVGK